MPNLYLIHKEHFSLSIMNITLYCMCAAARAPLIRVILVKQFNVLNNM